MDIINHLIQEKLVAVVRAENKEEGYKLADAIIKGGITAIEITFTIPEAEALILNLKKEFKESILIGAGTVLDLNMCKKAIENGAQYIVSPGFDLESAIYCSKKKIPYLPGCMTVTEIMNALKYDVKVIKLFPGDHFGPKFIKSIKAPLPNIKVMVTGGVDLDNISDWISSGADMIGIGSALTKHAKHGDYTKVTSVTKSYKAQIKDVLSCQKL